MPRIIFAHLGEGCIQLDDETFFLFNCLLSDGWLFFWFGCLIIIKLERMLNRTRLWLLLHCLKGRVLWRQYELMYRLLLDDLLLLLGCSHVR